MAVDDALDDGQADAGALEFLLAVQPLEDTEEFVAEFFVETDAVIFDRISHFLHRGSSRPPR